MAAAHAELIKEVEKGVRLRRAQSLDRSAPVIEAAQLHQSVHALLLHELSSKTSPNNNNNNTHTLLRHVPEDKARNKSAPRLEGDVRVKKSERAALKMEIEGGNVHLRHTEVTDKSSPLLPSPPPAPSAVAALMANIAGMHHNNDDNDASPAIHLLRHVEDAAGGDRSAPVIEAGVTLKRSELRKSLVGELADAGTTIKLTHVDSISDRSAPLIEPDVHVGKAEMPQVLAELKSRTQIVA